MTKCPNVIYFTKLKVLQLCYHYLQIPVWLPPPPNSFFHGSERIRETLGNHVKEIAISTVKGSFWNFTTNSPFRCDFNFVVTVLTFFSEETGYYPTQN